MVKSCNIWPTELWFRMEKTHVMCNSCVRFGSAFRVPSIWFRPQCGNLFAARIARIAGSAPCFNSPSHARRRQASTKTYGWLRLAMSWEKDVNQSHNGGKKCQNKNMMENDE